MAESDPRESDPREHPDRPDLPTASQPLNGPRRPLWKPLILTVAVFAVLIALYLLGAEFLVEAD